MARAPQVTRTIITTNCHVLCVDTVKKEPFEADVKLPRTYKDNKKLMKAVENAINTETVKAVQVMETGIEEILYGMSEAKFIANAEILPSRK